MIAWDNIDWEDLPLDAALDYYNQDPVDFENRFRIGKAKIIDELERMLGKPGSDSGRQAQIESQWNEFLSRRERRLQQLRTEQIKSNILKGPPFSQTSGKFKYPDTLLAYIGSRLARQIPPGESEPLHAGQLDAPGVELSSKYHQRHFLSAEHLGLGRLPLGYIEFYPANDDWYTFELARYWSPPEVDGNTAEAVEYFFDGLIKQLEKDYAAKDLRPTTRNYESIRSMEPATFGDWLEGRTQLLPQNPIEVDGGYFELDRARRVGGLHSWSIEAQWHPTTDDLPTFAVTHSGRLILMQFNIKSLDSGRPSEKPRSIITSSCTPRLDPLLAVYEELLIEIEQNWPISLIDENPLEKEEIKSVPTQIKASDTVPPTHVIDAMLNALESLKTKPERVTWANLQDKLSYLNNGETKATSIPILRGRLRAMWQDPKIRKEIDRRGLAELINGLANRIRKK